MKKKDLMSGFLGNGLTYWNRAAKDGNDYKTVAHISGDRTLKIYDENMPNDIREYLENFAAKGNDLMFCSSSVYFLFPVISFTSYEAYNPCMREAYTVKVSKYGGAEFHTCQGIVWTIEFKGERLEHVSRMNSKAVEKWLKERGFKC